MTVGAQVAEAIALHHPRMSRADVRERACQALEEVGIPAARRRYGDYPHQFSGGMRQRVMIAMAIVNRPSVIVADEPTTALDVTVQAQILDLLAKLCRERDTALVIVTHDLGVVAGIADEVAVMYAGRIVERAPVEDLFYGPAHPYTQGLLRAVPGSTSPTMSLSQSPDHRRPRPVQVPAARSAHDAHSSPTNAVLTCPPFARWPMATPPPASTQSTPNRDKQGEAHEGTQPVSSTSTPVLAVTGLCKTYHQPGRGLRARGHAVHAVDDVSFQVTAGETLAIVGESGSGKSTVGRCLLRLTEPSAGEIELEGRPLTTLRKRELRALDRGCRWCSRTPTPPSTLGRASTGSCLNPCTSTSGPEARSTHGWRKC